MNKEKRSNFPDSRNDDWIHRRKLFSYMIKKKAIEF